VPYSLLISIGTHKQANARVLHSSSLKISKTRKKQLKKWMVTKLRGAIGFQSQQSAISKKEMSPWVMIISVLKATRWHL